MPSDVIRPEAGPSCIGRAPPALSLSRSVAFNGPAPRGVGAGVTLSHNESCRSPRTTRTAQCPHPSYPARTPQHAFREPIPLQELTSEESRCTGSCPANGRQMRSGACMPRHAAWPTRAWLVVADPCAKSLPMLASHSPSLPGVDCGCAANATACYLLCRLSADDGTGQRRGGSHYRP